MIYIGEFLVDGKKVEPEDKRSSWFVIVSDRVAVHHFQEGPYHRGWGEVLTGGHDELGHPEVMFTRRLVPGKKQTVMGVTFEHRK